MLLCPVLYDARSFGGKMAFEDFSCFDGDKRLESLVLGMEMGGRVVRVIHADIDAEEVGNNWHEV